MYYLAPHKNSEVFDRGIEGLIKAGYKGNPSNYYKINEENKLSGNEIKELILNKKVRGKALGFEWSSSRSDEGEFEYTHYDGRTHKGKSWVDGDTLCYQFESLYDGIKYCAEIYNNPAGNKNELSEYLSLTDFWIYPFSIIE
jgi:hypothetical protein